MTREQPCVLVGVTGCIAAYKACEVIRGLQKAGVRCKVVMTEHAQEFVGSATFRALTHEPVAVNLFCNPADPIYHISLAQECDVFLIAPCTANVAAKIAHGIADDLLTTTALATRAPLILAPAMNVGMYEAAATQDNFALLRRRGVRLIDSDYGYQACGDEGKGRLADPARIVGETLDVLRDSLVSKADYAGKSVLVTAGPTQEAIDSVRFITNHSSGKMGYALAEAAQARGADVHLISGPVSLVAPEGVRLVNVKSAVEMHDAAREVFRETDITICSAAVADMRPANLYERKLKKGTDDELLGRIDLIENPDILATLGACKDGSQVVIGFAAETDDVVENARAKLDRKNADMIVANCVRGGEVFGSNQNEAIFVLPDVEKRQKLMDKRILADRILDEALQIAEQKRAGARNR